MSFFQVSIKSLGKKEGEVIKTEKVKVNIFCLLSIDTIKCDVHVYLEIKSRQLCGESFKITLVLNVYLSIHKYSLIR